MYTRNGPVMIKWFGNPDERDTVVASLRLHYWAAQQGAALAQLLPVRDGSVSLDEEDGVLAVFEYVDGAVGVADWKVLGRAVARLHTLGTPEFARRSRFCPRRSLPEGERHLTGFLARSRGQELHEPAERALGILRTLPSLRVLPIGIIHTDMGIAHTLTRSTGEVVFLDTLDIGVGPLAMDFPPILCEHLSHLDTGGKASRLNRSAACEFLEEYERIRPLTPHERRLILPIHRAYIICHAARYLDQAWRSGAPEFLARARTYFHWLDYAEQMIPQDLVPLLTGSAR
jgi:Ser/Thr protein kinase RdoA (MazF antagonist)